MDGVDRHLLELSGSGTVLLIATACAPEGTEVMERWEEMGLAHFQRLGINARPVRICDREDANRSENAERISLAKLVWFSGGRANYLAEVFHDTAAWKALEHANSSGSIVAGSSGGLGVLNAHIPGGTGPGPIDDDGVTPNGLGLAAPLRAMAHFERREARRPESVDEIRSRLAPGQVLIGVDENTACVWNSGTWTAMGMGRVVVFKGGGDRAIYRHGELIDLPKPLRSCEPRLGSP